MGKPQHRGARGPSFFPRKLVNECIPSSTGMQWMHHSLTSMQNKSACKEQNPNLPALHTSRKQPKLFSPLGALRMQNNFVSTPRPLRQKSPMRGQAKAWPKVFRSQAKWAAKMAREELEPKEWLECTRYFISKNGLSDSPYPWQID